MRETTAAQCPIHPMETQPCPVCLATMDNSMASYNTGYAAGYRAAQAAMPPRAYSQSEARRIAVTVLRERGAHLVLALKGGSEYDGSNLIALMELHARAMYDAWAQEQTSGSTEGRAGYSRDAGTPTVPPAAGIKPGPLDHQSAATPSAGRPDAEAAQAVTDGPAADPIADLCAELRATHCSNENLHDNAADDVERPARTERLLQAGMRHEIARAERAEAERDALREVVRAADGLRAECDQVPPMVQQRNVLHAYDAARAKVTLP